MGAAPAAIIAGECNIDGVTDERYRLHPVRDARERDERVRRGDLASAIGDAAGRATVVMAAEGRVATARAAVSAARVARAGCAGEAHRLAGADRYVERRQRDLAAAQAELDRAAAARDAQEGEVSAARTRLAGARADREVIERHFAAWRAQKIKDRERRED